jgi:hypothetical protein
MSADTAQAAADHHMRVDTVSAKPKKVLILVANPTTATTVGWRVGFWGAEQGGLFKAFTVRDGRLLTGQQQYSGRKVAQMLIDVLGI